MAADKWSRTIFAASCRCCAVVIPMREGGCKLSSVGSVVVKLRSELTVRTGLQFVVWAPRLLQQEVIDAGAVSPQRIIWRHEPAAGNAPCYFQSALSLLSLLQQSGSKAGTGAESLYGAPALGPENWFLFWTNNLLGWNKNLILKRVTKAEARLTWEITVHGEKKNVFTSRGAKNAKSLEHNHTHTLCPATLTRQTWDILLIFHHHFKDYLLLSWHIWTEAQASFCTDLQV